ncbi:serine/threonine protein kinase [Sediminibacterium sp. C3]|uniref:methylation-associated defense system protein kinase MAD6 n=1 Tax=Sediminibacterium sp. C3 TaxID=1267211 RepID=UPI000419E90B|nr:serine/threonine protein kinase [Sediminibacterium sp. C3]
MARIITPPFFDSVVNAGEKRLLDFLEVNLPDDYFLLPNLEIASTNPRNSKTQYWEYDLVIVAPHALYNIENKDWRGRIEGGDTYWYVNDKQKQNPLKLGRIKTAILASKIKEYNPAWSKAWIQNLLTLSYPNSYAPDIFDEAAKLSFELKQALIDYITDPLSVGQTENSIKSIQQQLVQFIIGSHSKKKPEEKREVEGYEILDILQQEQNFTEYLVKPKGVTSTIRKRVKEYALQVSGLSLPELQKRQDIITNQYKALNKIKAKPFILNVEFKIDEENHVFYEISDFLDENSLRAEARSRTFTFNEKIGFVKNIIAALREAHKENIFHRDINPDNIYVSGGYSFLGNFGKAYFTDHNQQGYTVMATLNETNATAYHPLELTVGDASRSSDIYSLGILIYWLFTGQEPVRSPFALDKMGGKLTPDLLPSAINGNLPKWLDDLCNKTIVVEREDRWDKVDELEAFLNQKLKDNDSQPIGQRAKQPSNSSSTISEEIKEGDRVGDYTIYQRLGKGGYSEVFKVRHTLQGKDYALKLFHESVNRASVTDEYNALRDLNHPNIVKFIWNGTVPSGQFYTVTEYLEGENLSVYTRTDARLPIVRVYDVAHDILSALREMQHQESPILHRDIKPQNIMWDKQEKFVLIDFNVASLVADNKDFVGTNPYLAPDLIEDSKVHWDKSADLFALGITLYELIAKQYPWAPDRFPRVSKDPEPLSKWVNTVSPAFEAFIQKTISTNPNIRFKDAAEMLNALEAIGKDGILRPITNVPIARSAVRNLDFDIVEYLNSLYSQSKHGNAGTRASHETKELDRLTYTQTKLDTNLIPAILDGQYKLVIITGNAGDGKTAFIKRIEEDNSIKNLSRFAHKNGARFEINGVLFESNYDGSQDENDKFNNDVLEDFFTPFVGLTNYNKANEGRLIAINEGRLIEFLNTSVHFKNMANAIEEYFYQEGHSLLPEGLLIINLNLRSVVAGEADNPSLFRKQVKALTEKSLWQKCQQCPIKSQCFIRYNVESLNDSASGDEVTARMEWLLRAVSLKRELHITMRDLRSFIAFMLTRDYSCKDVDALMQNGDPIAIWSHYYFNISDPAAVDGGNQDRLIKLLRETDIGSVAIPHLDRELFFGKHKSKDYLEFAERDLNLLDQFNQNKSLSPAHEQTSESVSRLQRIHKAFIRHQYYEGRAELIDTELGNVQMPSFLRRIPYQSLFTFVDLLKTGDEDDLTKRSISRAISLNEGCDNIAIDSKYLTLGSTEIKDPISKSFRLFALDQFELYVTKTDHLTKYLEYFPDSLVFRHTAQKHIKLTISLDLYEMLYFIQKGFSPSLNDIRGKFIELIIFKNLLENLSYKEVVVTRDNIQYFKISVQPNNKLHLEPMNL